VPVKKEDIHFVLKHQFGNVADLKKRVGQHAYRYFRDRGVIWVDLDEREYCVTEKGKKHLFMLQNFVD